MSLVRLQTATAEESTDVICPECHAEHRVIWGTEYGDPMFGEHTVECPVCYGAVTFDCDVVYHTMKKQPNSS